ncbi:MAG: bifunctional phosphoribosylaminoimidazolecarboxamide formyltransferase/IMP cyclohydrolase [Hyphomicrobiales bacterium]
MAGRIRRALISVSDKACLLDLARDLEKLKIAIIATGGTAARLAEAGIAITDVSSVTGFPEILDGRVKTLHPNVHGGILARRDDEEHMRTLSARGIGTIDLVVVNLYPFEATVQAGKPFDEIVENIDIGGPAMIRAAAKNFRDVVVVVDPSQYGDLLTELQGNDGCVSDDLRRRFATEAFCRTAAYDAAVSNWLLSQETDAPAPKWRALGGTLVQALRYGENPHQQASFYRLGAGGGGLAGARQVQGKELSYNNINDADAAFRCVGEFARDERAACVIVKHANPCGVAVAATLKEAYAKAFACDPTSAFGGIVALNRPLTEDVAQAILDIFTEVVIAPAADDAALALFARKPNIRLLIASPGDDDAGMAVRTVSGGFLVQDPDAAMATADELKVVTMRSPTPEQRADMLFAMKVAKHVKSNAIVLAAGGATLGIGAGQMSRVDSTRIAAQKARETLDRVGAKHGDIVAASDAFFPFADGLREVVGAGATAVIQPGGSMRDEEVIAAANDLGVAMVFTGLRHFLH